MHTNNPCIVIYHLLLLLWAQMERVRSSRMWGKMVKGALRSYSHLSVMLIILMWVEIGPCWPRGGRRRSLKSELKYTPTVACAASQRHAITHQLMYLSWQAWQPFHIRNYRPVLIHTHTHMHVYAQTRMYIAVNQAKWNVGQRGFSYCGVWLVSDQVIIKGDTHPQKPMHVTSVIPHQVWLPQRTPGRRKQQQWGTL